MDTAKILFFLTVLFLNTSHLNASHIIAGFASYEHIAEDTFEITFTLFRDENSDGALFDKEISVQLFTYDRITETHIYDKTVNVEIDFEETIIFDPNSSPAALLNLEIAYAKYSFETVITGNNADHLFAYQRCCRSDEFANVAEPEASGMTLLTKITDEARILKNSSIKFDVFPGFFASLEEGMTTVFPAESLDEDELVYEFNPSYLGGGTSGATSPGDPTACDGVIPHGPCYPPYQEIAYNFTEGTYDYPFHGWQDLGMDTLNGRLMGFPAELGQFSYGFAIHEYRNNEVINTSYFDYVLYVYSGVSNAETEQNVEESILVYPNPFEENFTLDVQNGKIYYFRLLDINGREISHTISKVNSKWNLTINEAPGIYILKVFGEGGENSIKLIKI